MKNVIAKAFRKVISTVAAFILALAGFTYNTNTNTSAAEELSPADQIVVLVNEARVEAGLAPLKAVPVINDAAAIRAEESSVVFSHTRPDSTRFGTVLNGLALPFYTKAGENLAAGYDNAADTFEQWRNSAGHWANIMNPDYTHIGVACYNADDEYGYYWTQLFITCSTDIEGQYIPGETAEAPSVVYGDVDGNGRVNSKDLSVLLKDLTTGTQLSEVELETADCMNDGSITISDAIVLKKYILGQYEALPVRV